MRNDRRSLKHVKAAQLRAKVVRWAIGQSALGTLFLMGAFSYALGPAPTASSSLFWIAALVVLSTFHVGLGMRTLARVMRWPARTWLTLALLWGGLATIVMKFLVKR